MNQVPDRENLRREYLRKKGMLYTASLAVVGLMVFLCFQWNRVFIALIGFTKSHPYLAGYGMAAMMLLPSVCVSILRFTAKKTKEVTYVHVTPDTLPADEILVRAAEEPPVAQNEVLLRAAQGQETPKEELLRVAKE